MCENTRPLTWVWNEVRNDYTRCYRARLPNKAIRRSRKTSDFVWYVLYHAYWSSPQDFCVSITFPYFVCSMMNLFIFNYPWALLPDNIKKILNLGHGNADFQYDYGRIRQGTSSWSKEAPQLQPMQLHLQMAFHPRRSPANSQRC